MQVKLAWVWWVCRELGVQAVYFLLTDNVPPIMSSWVARKCEELGKRMIRTYTYFCLQKGVSLWQAGLGSHWRQNHDVGFKRTVASSGLNHLFLLKKLQFSHWMDGWMIPNMIFTTWLHKVLTLIEYCNMSFLGVVGYNNTIFLSFLALLIVYMHGQMQPAWEFGGVHVLCILSISDPFTLFYLYWKPHNSPHFSHYNGTWWIFAAMKCKGASGISLYPFLELKL
jgi:hypothetical protein